MRIVHVTSSLKRGGAETVLVSLLTHPLCDPIEHHVIYFHDGPLKELLVRKNIRLYHIAYGPLFFFRFLYCIYRINPDKIHALLWFAMAIGSITGFFLKIPVIVVFHNNIDQNKWYKNYIDWFVLRLATRFIAVSEPVAQSICRYHRWISRSHITIIHNGIDMPKDDYRYEGKKFREKHGIAHDVTVLGSVGRFEEVKRYTWLLDCFAAIRETHTNIHLVLVGTGSQEQMLKSYADKKNIRENVSFIVNQNAYMIYPCFDIFTLTSEKEGISIALLEAMSFGKICLITNSELTHSVINNEHNGFIVKACDKQAFYERIIFLMSNLEKSGNMQENARYAVTQLFSRDMMVNHYRKQFLSQMGRI